MANLLGLSIKVLGLVEGVKVTVSGRQPITPATETVALAADTIKIRKLNGNAFGDFKLDTDYTVTAVTGDVNSVIIKSKTGTPTFTFDEGDLLLIHIEEDGKKSDRVSVDFSEVYVGHGAVVPFEVPSEAGTYKLNVQTVNEDADFSTVASAEFVVGKEPLSANSSIALNYKPYLVKYVGTKHNVKVVLNNAANDAAEGSYEVIFKATKQ